MGVFLVSFVAMLVFINQGNRAVDAGLIFQGDLFVAGHLKLTERERSALLRGLEQVGEDE